MLAGASLVEPDHLKSVVVQELLDLAPDIMQRGATKVDDTGAHVNSVSVQVLLNILPHLPLVGREQTFSVRTLDPVPVRALDLHHRHMSTELIYEDVEATAASLA